MARQNLYLWNGSTRDIAVCHGDIDHVILSIIDLIIMGRIGRLLVVSRGSELIESFVQLLEDSRVKPYMIMMGDSTFHETYTVGLCSLARVNISFVMCQKSLGIDQFEVDTRAHLASS